MHRPLVLGIAGGSGSGKTTLASSVRDHFGDEAVLIGHDAYYRDLSHLTLEERAQVNFDHPDSLDSDLLAAHVDALRAGRSVPRFRYDYVEHRRLAVEGVVESRPIIVVEGILVLSVPELRRAFDRRVFVATDEIERFIRRIRRDVAERGRTISTVCDQFIHCVQPMHAEFVEPARQSADQVVSGRAPIAENTAAVVTAVERLRASRTEGAV